MIIVTLVASLASAMVWRQYRAVQIEAAERARAQAAWILIGALDYGRLILGSDQLDVDHLNDPWAVPLEETRLSTFLAADKTAADSGPEAFLYGGISDAQALYNLRNLIPGAQVAPAEQRTLERLCETAGTAPGTATLIISRLRQALGNKAQDEDVPLRPRSLDQMAWLGLDADTITRLRPFVTLLPETPSPTPVNLNTAPREVIAALLDVDLASAERLVQARKAKPLTQIEQAKDYLPVPKDQPVPATRASVTSAYFFVSGRLRLEERVLEERSLVHRIGRNNVRLVHRERLSQVLPPAKP